MRFIYKERFVWCIKFNFTFNLHLQLLCVISARFQYWIACVHHIGSIQHTINADVSYCFNNNIILYGEMRCFLYFHFTTFSCSSMYLLIASETTSQESRPLEPHVRVHDTCKYVGYGITSWIGITKQVNKQPNSKQISPVC